MKFQSPIPMLRGAALLAVLLTIFTGGLLAESVNHTEAQVKVWIPDNWVQEADEDSLIVTDPEEEVMVAFMVVDGENIEAALEAMEMELGSLAENVQADGEPEEVELNGMPAIVLDAKGTIDGEAVDMGVAVIITPAEKALLVFAVAQSSKVDKHTPTIEKILGGIQPMK